MNNPTPVEPPPPADSVSKDAEKEADAYQKALLLLESLKAGKQHEQGKEVMSYAEAQRRSKEEGIPIIKAGSEADKDLAALEKGAKEGFGSAAQKEELLGKLQKDLGQTNDEAITSKFTAHIREGLDKIDKTGISGATNIESSTPPAPKSVPNVAAKGADGLQHP